MRRWTYTLSTTAAKAAAAESAEDIARDSIVTVMEWGFGIASSLSDLIYRTRTLAWSLWHCLQHDLQPTQSARIRALSGGGSWPESFVKLCAWKLKVALGR